MTKQTKILLITSLAGFAAGFGGLYHGIGMPVGAIFLGLFLISRILEKEAALFDNEQHLQPAPAANGQAAGSLGDQLSTPAQGDGVPLRAAHSHQ